MKRLTTGFAIAALSGWAFSASAQAPAPPPNQGPQPDQPRAPAPQQGQQPQPQPQQQQPTVDVSDADLDTFTSIYVEVQEISEDYDARMASAEDPQEAQQLQTEMREEILETISDEGWTQQQYSETARAINNDQELLEEAMALIQQKSS